MEKILSGFITIDSFVGIEVKRFSELEKNEEFLCYNFIDTNDVVYDTTIRKIVFKDLPVDAFCHKYIKLNNNEVANAMYIDGEHKNEVTFNLDAILAVRKPTLNLLI